MASSVAVSADGALAPATHLVSLDPDGVTEVDQACLVQDEGYLRPPGDAAPWLHVQLPHLWSTTHPGFQGTLWYRFQVNLPKQPKSMWAIYLPKVVMNAQVWVNGVPLGYTGSMTHPVTRHWYVPLIFNVTPEMWKPGRNVVLVRVASGIVARNGLGAVKMGPQDQLGQIYQKRYLVQVDAVRVANVALLTLGCFMLIAWMRDHEQTAIGFMGLAAVTWGLSSLIQLAPEPLTSLLSWIRTGFTLDVASKLLLCLFFFRFAGKRRIWVERCIFATMVLVPAQVIAWPSMIMLVVTFIGIYALTVWSMAEASWHVWEHKRQDGGWLLAACAILAPVGVHDMLIILNVLPYDSLYWLYYSGPIVLGCITVIMAGDVARSRQELRNLNLTLADRVATREAELLETFERMATLERNQAVLAERSRILKDMHDGVGAHLTSALRQLQGREQQAVDMPLVTQTLRDSLDQLKLTIDALSLMPGDVEGLLASWRFRLTPRLKAAGIELVWDVEQLPPWPQGQPPFLRQIQYILFEGLSNVLQHSGATRLVLSARHLGHCLQVSLIDNGCGWSRSTPPEGQGLQTMHTRAQAIGALLELLPQADGGLELRLSLPMEAVAAATPDEVSPPSAADVAPYEVRTGTS